MAAEDSEVHDEEIEGDHSWHFRYNRRLSCFSHAVSSLTFSQDGKYLVSGTGSGDVKVWDTGCWAEAARLKGSRREEPKSLVISPAQRWLVSAYSSVLQVFNCQSPWRLEQSLPAMVDVSTKEVCQWCCVAFSPMAEVNHPNGQTGQDNHLAAFSTGHLVLMDYSSGWGEDISRRTRSLLHSVKPTSLDYTADGWWLVAGYENGQLQIWNAFSLTLERTLAAHTGRVNSLTSSPTHANYEARFVSCGEDQTLRVWHASGWILEQVVSDTRCDRAGIRSCTFSSSGEWLVSVATELCIWRVCLTRLNERLVLNMHQRLLAVCGAEGLRTAAFCGHNDAIAVGSRDGVLGLWTKCPGPPLDTPPSLAPQAKLKGEDRRGISGEAWRIERQLARPMCRITPDGVRPNDMSLAQTGRKWLQTTRLRTMPAVVPGGLRKVGAESPSDRLSAAGSELSSQDSDGSAGPGPGPSRAVVRSTSTPELLRWRSERGNMCSFQDAVPTSFGRTPSDALRGKMTAVSLPSKPLSTTAAEASPVQKNIMHASRRLVKRISLEPHIIS